MQQYPFERFAAYRRYFDFAFTLDSNDVLYTCNASGQFNVWRQPLHRSGHPYWPAQLTTFEEDVARFLFPSPTQPELVFFADHQGTENLQVYRLSYDGGWYENITMNHDVRHEPGFESYSPDGRYLAYSSNERSRTSMDVVIHELLTGERRTIAEGGFLITGRWSPEGSKLIIYDFHLTTDNDLLLFDTDSGSTTNLTKHEGEALFLPGPWSPDGSGFYMATNLDSEYIGLAFYDLSATSFRWLKQPRWDVEAIDLSKDGRFLAWAVNEDGYSVLHVEDLHARSEMNLPDLPRGVLWAQAGVKFSPDGLKLGLFLSTPYRPYEFFVLYLDEMRVVQVTDGFLGRIPEEDMVEPQLVRYPSLDGLQIPAFLYRPRTPRLDVKVPVVVHLHGGPESQERPSYIYGGLYQYLLNRGIAVLAPNFRGSTGYGRVFRRLIHHDWGGGELEDIRVAAEYLKSLDWVDGERLGVFGGSFGGFATLSAITRLPKYWKAAVSIVGPSNLVTFVKTTVPHWKDFVYELVGDPEKEEEFLRSRSPITYVHNVVAALLVIQGANDPRVPKAESDQMVERLRSLGRTVDYMVFEDEGHGFTKAKNLLRAWQATAEFVVKHLLGK